MPFPSALTGGNYTSLRTTYSARHYVALCPNATVFQIRPSSASGTGTYAEIPYSTVVTGTRTNVQIGQTVLITAGTDLRRPLWRGRVRKAPTANTLFINETGFALNTSHYVTVINTYDVAPRLPRIDSNGSLFIDWDVTYQGLGPLIGGLQSAYIVPTTSATASLSFAPTAIAVASGTSISSWAWNVADGTITVGSASTQNVTVSFPTDHRWVRLTVTDSAGVSNYFVFEVYVGNPYSSALFYEVTESTVNADASIGYSATVTARSGVASVLEQTRATLFSVERYGTSATPIVNNIECIGYIRQESVTTSVNPQTLLVQSVTFDIEGFLNKLATTPISAIRMDNASPASTWGQVPSLTPARAMAYLLQYHTSASNLIGVTFDSDAQDYVFPQLTVEANNAVDAINSLGDAYNARMNIAPDGTCAIRRQAVYLDDTARNALTTVALIEAQDVLSYGIQRDHIQTIAQCVVGAARYDTGSADVAIFTGRAPGVALGEGYEETQLNGQILKADISDADARVEVARRTANHLAAVNPTDELTVELRDGWRFVVPCDFQWYTFSLPASDNNRNIAYFSNNRFLLRSVTFSATPTGRKTVSATFRRETQDTQAQIVVSRVPLGTDTPLPVLPVLGEFPSLGIDGAINYPTDDPSPFDLQPFSPQDLSQLSPLPAEDAALLAEEAMPAPNCETITLNFASNATKSSDTTNLLYDYNIKVTGDALISAAALTWSETFDFTASTDRWRAATRAEYVGGAGWRRSAATQTRWEIELVDAITTNITNVAVTYNRQNYVLPSATSLVFVAIGLGLTVNSTPYSVYSGVVPLLNWSNSTPFAITASRLQIRATSNIGFAAPFFPSDLYITGITLTGTGVNPFTGINPSTPVRGDAFYYGYDSGAAVAYSAGQGLLINGAQPVNYPQFSASHEYNLTIAGTGNPFTYQFVDPDSDYTNNNPNPLTIVQCRGAYQGT